MKNLYYSTYLELYEKRAMVYDLKVNLMFIYKYYTGHEIAIVLWA